MNTKARVWHVYFILFYLIWFDSVSFHFISLYYFWGSWRAGAGGRDYKSHFPAYFLYKSQSHSHLFVWVSQSQRAKFHFPSEKKEANPNSHFTHSGPSFLIGSNFGELLLTKLRPQHQKLNTVHNKALNKLWLTVTDSLYNQLKYKDLITCTWPMLPAFQDFIAPSCSSIPVEALT